MGASFDINVDLIDNSDEVRRAFEAACEKALTEIGIEAEGNCKDILTENGIRDTGRLINSITWAIEGDKSQISTYTGDHGEPGKPYRGKAPKRKLPAVFIGTNVDYAVFIETGARGKAPRPFLRLAIVDYVDQYKEILENNLKNG